MCSDLSNDDTITILEALLRVSEETPAQILHKQIERHLAVQRRATAKLIEIVGFQLSDVLEVRQALEAEGRGGETPSVDTASSASRDLDGLMNTRRVLKDLAKSIEEAQRALQAQGIENDVIPGVAT